MHLPCRTVLHCCSSLGKGKGDSEEEHTEAAVARLPWILASARAAIATDQPAQQGLLLEQSRLCPLRPRSQFVFLAACGTRPCCSRWRAASTRTLELLRYLAASKRPAAPHMVMGHAGAVAAVQLKKAYFLCLPLEVLCSRGRRSTFAADPTDKEVDAGGSNAREGAPLFANFWPTCVTAIDLAVSHSLQAQHDSLVHPPLGIDTPTHAGEQWHGAGSLRHAARAGSRRGTPRAQTRPRIHTQLTLHTHT